MFSLAAHKVSHPEVWCFTFVWLQALNSAVNYSNEDTEAAYKAFGIVPDIIKYMIDNEDDKKLFQAAVYVEHHKPMFK